jgi:hypothetical protein
VEIRAKSKREWGSKEMERKSRPLRGEEELLTKEYMKKSELFKTVIKIPKRPFFFCLSTRSHTYPLRLFFFSFFIYKSMKRH